MNLREFLRTAGIYRKTFAAAAVTVLALGAAWLVLTPLQYVSTAQLLVSVSGTSTANAYQNNDVVAARVNSYVALMTSDVVGQRVIDKLGLRVTPRQLAAKVSAVQVPPNTAVIDVAAVDSSPDQARKIADTVANEFVGYTKALESPTGEDAQKVQTSIVSAASQPRSRVIERIALAGLIAVLAVLTGACAVWLRSITDRVVRTSAQAADAADAPVFELPDSQRADSIEALEPYRRLRAVLDRHSGAVVQISPVDEDVEARSLAVNLGRAIMLSGDSCVVLDATGRPAEESGEPDSGWPGVNVVGQWADDPETASGPAAQSVIGPLTREYRYVVIATPPMLSSSTSSLVSEFTDAVVLAVSLGATSKSRVVSTVKSLRGLGTTVAGVLALGDTD